MKGDFPSARQREIPKCKPKVKYEIPTLARQGEFTDRGEEMFEMSITFFLSQMFPEKNQMC